MPGKPYDRVGVPTQAVDCPDPVMNEFWAEATINAVDAVKATVITLRVFFIRVFLIVFFADVGVSLSLGSILWNGRNYDLYGGFYGLKRIKVQ